MSLRHIGTFDQKNIKIVVLTDTNHGVYQNSVVTQANRTGATKFLSQNYTLEPIPNHDLLGVPRTAKSELSSMKVVVISSDDETDNSDMEEGDEGDASSSSLTTPTTVKTEPDTVSNLFTPQSKGRVLKERGVFLSKEYDTDTEDEVEEYELLRSLNQTLTDLEVRQASMLADPAYQVLSHVSTEEGRARFSEEEKEISAAQEAVQEEISSTNKEIADITRKSFVKMEASRQKKDAQTKTRARLYRAGVKDSYKDRLRAKTKKHARDMKAMMLSVRHMQTHLIEKREVDHIKKTEAGLREGWMADTILQNITTRTQRYFSYRGSVEVARDRALRMWFWDLVTASLPNHTHLYIELVVGDLRALWIKVTTFNQPNARHTYTTIMKGLLTHTKKREVGYNPWQRQLEQHFINLAVVRRELSDPDKKMYLLDLIVTDTRYRVEVTECDDDEKITYFEACGRLLQRATRCKNLITDPTKREGNLAATPEANLGETKTGSGGKGGKDKTDKKKSTDKDKTSSNADVEQRSKQICERFLFGKCSWNDKCHYKHVDLAKITKPGGGRGSGGKGKGGKGRGKGGKGKGKDKEKDEANTCFSWDETGKCSRGDTCHFAHVGTGSKPAGDT